MTSAELRRPVRGPACIPLRVAGTCPGRAVGTVLGGRGLRAIRVGPLGPGRAHQFFIAADPRGIPRGDRS